MILALIGLFVSCSQEEATPDALISGITVSCCNEKEGRTNATPVNGQPLLVQVAWKNNSGTGTMLFGGDISYKCYLSKDEALSSDDVILVNDGKLTSYDSSSTGGNWVSSFPCNLPPSTAAGAYYCIFVRTGGEKGDFIKVSPAFTVDKFVSLGAFKVYNSWGKTVPTTYRSRRSSRWVRPLMPIACAIPGTRMA
jgi:hypothetical protein